MKTIKKQLYKNSKASLNLMEIIVSVFILIVVSAVCIRFFAASYLLNRDSEQLEQGLLLTGSFAEAFIAEGGDISGLKELYPNADIQENELIIYYNEAYEECPSEEAQFFLRANISGEGLKTGLLSFSDKEKAIYSLNVKVAENERTQ